MKHVDRQYRACLACGGTTEHVRLREGHRWLEWQCVNCQGVNRDSGDIAAQRRPDKGDKGHLHRGGASE